MVLSMGGTPSCEPSMVSIQTYEIISILKQALMRLCLSLSLFSLSLSLSLSSSLSLSLSLSLFLS